MPEHPLVQEYRTNAIAALGTYLESLQSCRELRSAETSAYNKRSFVYGWEISVEFSDRRRRLQVLLPNMFPFAAARIALVDRPEFLTWPHVERDGVLCLLANNATVSSVNPIGAVKDLLALAVDLVEASITKSNQADFEAEFHTYWDYEANQGAKKCFSLMEIRPEEDRLVRCWEGKDFALVADSDKQIRLWLSNRFGSTHEKDKFINAALVWLPNIPHPAEYPRTVRDAFHLIGPRRVFEKLIRDDVRSARIFFAGQTVNGLVLAGIIVHVLNQKNVMGRTPSHLIKGFRPGRVPPQLLQARFFETEAAVTRLNVTRIDHSWVHGRDQDASRDDLKATHVVVAGCGSLGSLVASELAQAGVGLFSFVDPETLEWANISRHVLGAQYVGVNKADALAKHLRKQFPHLQFEPYSLSIENVLANDPSLFTNCGLVINTTGAWSATSLLDLLHSGDDEDFPATLHAWMERSAAAAHAVLMRDNSSIRNGFDELGKPILQITDWDRPSFQEPACGAVFEPYGSAEVAYSAALVTGFAIDYMTNQADGPTHRMWIDTRTRLITLGGRWSANWQANPNFREEGGFYVSQDWPSPRNSTK